MTTNLKKLLQSNRGVSGAISGMFVLLILFLAITSVYAYHVTQDNYNQVVTKRHQIDWERLNERIIISSVDVLDDMTLSAVIKNEGSVTAHLVTLWLSAFNSSGSAQWQRQYKIDIWISSEEIKDNFGQSNYNYFLVKPGNSMEFLNSIQLAESWIYAMKIVTERGNIASYSPIPDIMDLEGGGGYPIVIVADHYNFQYTAGTMTEFEPAYIKPRSTDRTLYRILLNNTTNHRIFLKNNCTMLQIQGAVGAINERFLVSDQSTSWPDNLVSFNNQILDPGEAKYLYFAATIEGGNEWQVESTKKDYYLIGFLISFVYEGETITRTISLPNLIQELT